MSLGLLRVPTTKRWHTAPDDPGEFRRDNLQGTGAGLEKAPGVVMQLPPLGLKRQGEERELPERQERATWRGFLSPEERNFANPPPNQDNLLGSEPGE